MAAHTSARRFGVTLAAVTAVACAACSSGGSSNADAATTCRTYLAGDAQSRDATVHRIAVARGDEAALAPLAQPNIDAICAAAPSTLLAVAIDRTAGKAPAGGATAADGSSGADSSRASSSTAGSSTPSSAGPSGAADEVDATLTDPAAVQSLLQEAKRAVATVNTYDWRTFAANRAASLAVTTGRYTTDFAKTFDSVIVRYGAKLHATTQSAQIDEAGVEAMSGDTASVILFGQLTATNNSTAAGGRVDPLAVVVRMQRVGGSWRIAELDADAGPAPDPAQLPGNGPLQAAFRAALRAAAALQSFRLSSFDADYDSALSLTTGALRSDLVGLRDRTRSTLQAQHEDLDAEIEGAGVAQVEAARVQVLVTLNGYQVIAGRRSAPVPQRLLVTVQRVGDRWLASDVSQRGTS